MRETQIAVSPCSNPDLGLDDVLAAYVDLGYRKFEIFTTWAKSAFDFHGDPAPYAEAGRRHGMAFHSLHLPPVCGDRIGETLGEAVAATAFAAALGVQVVLYKASDRPTYVNAAQPFLDAVEPLGITPVIQNHYGTPLTTLDDVCEVMDGVNDPRLRSLLEVGHYHTAGVGWRDACAALGDTIALVHVKDQVGRQSVPFGRGEIDLPGLFDHLDTTGYDGACVIEMEVADKENTLEYLGAALAYVRRFCEEDS